MTGLDLAARVGANIRAVREDRGLRQYALAGHAGVTGARLSQFEHGHLLPSLDVLFRIANVLQCPLIELIKGAGPDPEAYSVGFDDGWAARTSDLAEYIASKPAGVPYDRVR